MLYLLVIVLGIVKEEEYLFTPAMYIFTEMFD